MNYKFPKIIAECGKNFITRQDTNTEECFQYAMELADTAKEYGADAVKFQTHVLEDERIKRDPSRYTWLELNENLTPYDVFWLPLKVYCDKIGILFMTTPMSRLAAIKANPLVEVWKVGSADIVDMDLLEYLASTGKPIILSTGMSTLSQIDSAVDFLKKKKSEFALLHCVSLYPCPFEKLNLNTILFLKERYPSVPIGFSDHSVDIEPPAYAVRLGAEIIEKHFTLDKSFYGPDQKMSLEPDEFKKMVDLVYMSRLDRTICGKKEKIVLDEEKDYWDKFRKNR